MMAMSGVPMIIADNADCRAWLPEPNHFQLYSPERGPAQNLQDFIANRERWISMANSLRQSLRRTKSSDECVQQWLSLFRNSILERKA